MGRIHGALTVVDISDSCEGKFDRISQVSLLQFMTCIRKIFFCSDIVYVSDNDILYMSRHDILLYSFALYRPRPSHY